MNKRNLIFTTFTFLIIFVVIYLLSVAFRAWPMYSYITKGERGWVGDVFRYDERLGYSLKSNGSGFELFPDGRKVPIYLDENGHRISRTSNDEEKRKSEVDILYLGDSFTFGTGVKNENSFVSIVQKRLEFSSINASVPGFGPTQMVIRAKSIIGKYKSKYVVVQYSPWLVLRAMKSLKHNPPYVTPVPYYSNEDPIKIQKPLLASSWHAPSFYSFYKADPTITGFLVFLFSEGVPLIFQNDINKVFVRGSLALGLKMGQ